MNNVSIFEKEFTKDDFIETSLPYEYAYSFNDDKFNLERVLTKISDQASKYNIRNFKTMYKLFAKNKNKKNNINDGNFTNFEGQRKEWSTGIWVADNFGVATINNYGTEEYACVHPILITERLTNIDTGYEKVKIQFSRLKNKDNKWREIIIDKKTIASNNKIIDLADMGVAVTSETSKLLVRYLHDFEHENYADIPQKKCCSRLGWLDDDTFSPYCSELIFDGDTHLSQIFKSVTAKGNLQAWKNEMINLFNYNYINKIVVGASFASVLVKMLGINNFFVHLWADTETAKTVSIMAGASIWADPTIGKYIQTFNSTSVGKERIAELCNSLPVFFDELQIISDRVQFDKEIYELSEGAGRLRGNKFGGTDRTSTWENCFITTGEKPITSDNSAGGAVNRILEVECTSKLVFDGKETCNIIKNNYGLAGKLFIDHIKTQDIRKIFLEYYKSLESDKKTEKQTSIGAVILTAFNIASNLLFNNAVTLTIDEISEFLVNKATTSSHDKAYGYLCDFIARNINKFKNKDSETYGKLEEVNEVYIINSVFNKMCTDGGFNSKAFTSWLIKNNKLTKDKDGKNTVIKRIGGIATRCLKIEINYADDIPFE